MAISASTPVLLATTNPGKLREFKGLMHGWLPPDRIRCLSDLSPVPPPEENGASFLANARIKAEYYSGAFPGVLVVAEDSGLSVSALGGRPGIHSARFAGPPFSDARNIDRLLERLKDAKDRSASFITQAVVALDGRELFHCRGEVAGRILATSRGAGGFGYDPVFFFPPLGKSFAELRPAEKNRVSHRGRAMEKIRDFLINLAKETGG